MCGCACEYMGCGIHNDMGLFDVVSYCIVRLLKEDARSASTTRLVCVVFLFSGFGPPCNKKN